MKKGKISILSKIDELITPAIEAIDSLTRPQRLLICVGTFVAVVGVFIYFFYMPKYKEIDSLKNQKSSLESKLNSVKAKAKDLAKYRRQMQEAENKFQIALKALPDKKELSSFLDNISDTGKESGLSVLLFQPQKDIIKDFYAEIPVALHVSGDYYQLVTFFDSASRLSRIVNIKDITMRASKDTKILDTKCTVVTYRFVEVKKEVKKRKNTTRRRRR